MAEEAKVQNKICEHLQKKGLFFFRTNNSPVYDQKLNSGLGGYRSQGKWAASGLPDIIGIVNGRFVGLEVKSTKGKQSSDQVLFERRCKNNGGIYAVVRSVSDVDKVLTMLDV